jgi:hypothetical protein
MSVIRWRVLGATLTHGAYPAWLAAGGVAWAYVIGWFVSRIFSTDAAATARYAGTLLEIFGVVNVAIGLHETRKLFPGRSSIGDRVRAWLKQVAAAFHPPQPITAQGQAAGVAIVAGRARVRRGVGLNASVDDRLDALQNNLNALQEEMDAELRDLTTKIDRASTALDRERNERKKADDTAIRLIEEATIGGLNLEAVGLLWLTLGVLGSGFADEIARLLR